MISLHLLNSFHSELVKIAKMGESDLEDMKRRVVSSGTTLGALGGGTLGGLVTTIPAALLSYRKPPSTRLGRALAMGIPAAGFIGGGIVGAISGRRKAKRQIAEAPRELLEASHDLTSAYKKDPWMNSPDFYSPSGSRGPGPEVERAWVKWHSMGKGRNKLPYLLRPDYAHPEYYPAEWAEKHRDVIKKSYPGVYE